MEITGRQESGFFYVIRKVVVKSMFRFQGNIEAARKMRSKSVFLISAYFF